MICSAVLILLSILSISKQECTFLLSDLPVPPDSLIYGDPRDDPTCFQTSFEESRPSDLFNPDGRRMWTREMDSMATSEDPVIQSKVKVMLENPMMVERFISVVLNENTGEEFDFVSVLKAATTTMFSLIGPG